MIDHVGITTADLDRAVRFYTDVIGLKLVGTSSHSDPGTAALLGLDSVELTIADLDAGDGRIVELLHYSSPAGQRIAYESWNPATTHIAFRVPDLEAMRERLEAARVGVISTRPLSIEDPGGPWDGATCLYIRDPDGVILELVQRRG